MGLFSIFEKEEEKTLQEKMAETRKNLSTSLQKTQLQRASSSGSSNTEAFFSGGPFSDVIDILNVPFYGMSGVAKYGNVSGFYKGIKERTAISDVLDIKNPIIGIVVDIAFDPLIYVGGFGLTKKGLTSLKYGKIASYGKEAEAVTSALKTTLSAQGRAGQRALLTLDVPFIKQLQGIPLVPQAVSKKTLSYVTVAAERTKQLSLGKSNIGDLLEKLGGRKATNVVSKLDNLDEIEKAATSLEQVALIKKGVKASQEAMSSEVTKIASSLRDEAVKLTKKLDLTDEDIFKITEALYDKTKEVPEAFKKFVTKIEKEAKTLEEIYVKYGGDKLEGAVLPNMLKQDIANEIAGFKIGGREAGGKATSELGRKYTAFVNANADQFAGKLEGKAATILDKTGTKITLSQIEEGVFAPEKLVQAVKNLKAGKLDEALEIAEANVAKLDGSNLTKAKRGAAEKLAHLRMVKKYETDKGLLATMKAERPDLFFTRLAKSPAESGAILKKFGAKTADAFEQSPFRLLAAKGKIVAKKRASTQFLERIKNSPFAKKLVKGANLEKGFKRSSHPALKDYAFEENVIDIIDATYESFSSMRSVNEFIAGYDKLLNFWKGTATFINPAFHTRNAISNMWQISLSKVNPFLAYKDGTNTYKMISYANKHDIPLYNIFHDTDAQRKLMKKFNVDKTSMNHFMEFIEDGLGGAGVYFKDIEGPMSKLQHNFVFEAGGDVGRWLEDSAKLGMYIQKRKKGFSRVSAGEEVKKFLFDYGDLTNTEREMFKRVFPFYTWTRKNIPLQVAMLIQEPAKFGSIAKIKANVERSAEGKPMDEKYLPGWLKEAYPIYFGKDSNGMQRFFKLEGFLPAVDINKLFRPGEMLLESASPLIKTPLEMVANHSFFYESEIQKFEGQKDKLIIDMPSKVAYMLGQLRPLKSGAELFALTGKDEYPEFRARLFDFVFGKVSRLDQKNQKSVYQWVKNQITADISSEIKDAVSKKNFDYADELRVLKRRIQRDLEEIEI